MLDGYDELVRRLTERLKSADRAHDALQDAFLKIASGPDLGPIGKPAAFILRVATNIAIDRRRSEDRRLSQVEIEDLIQIPDEAPSPADAAEARSDLAAFSRALAGLPERRRAILEASLDEVPRREIARRFGVSERTIDFELKRALDHARATVRGEN